jgi:hypothetical protein
MVARRVDPTLTSGVMGFVNLFEHRRPLSKL